MKNEVVYKQLTEKILPFWNAMRDDENGGFYGYMSEDLHIDDRADKGCILNSRILWFYSTAYMYLQDEKLLDNAKHAFEFLKTYCFDPMCGGIFWSVRYNGKPADTTKHTYNQAFAIYALSAYYEATGSIEAIAIAEIIYEKIEDTMRDTKGYLEAFTRDFRPADNDKLSENGVMAERTMNTLLHIIEAYSALVHALRKKAADPVKGDVRDELFMNVVENKLAAALELMRDKFYNSDRHRLDVFFDKEYESLIDLTSYGHDIEASWLLEWAAGILDDEEITESLHPISSDLVEKVYKEAFDGHSIVNECEDGEVNTDRIWWVEAESVLGFLKAFEREGKEEYRKAAHEILAFILDKQVDKREGSEWFEMLKEDGTPCHKPMVRAWKCPYHNGRMCLEILKSGIEIG